MSLRWILVFLVTVVSAVTARADSGSIDVNVGGTISGSFSSGSITISTGTVTGGVSYPPSPPPPFSITDPLLFDLSTGASLKLTTTQDILVLDLSRATRDFLKIRAGTKIDFEDPTGLAIDLSGIAATQCDGDACQSAPLDLTRDVIVNLPAAYSNLDLVAGGEIMYLVPPLPEPGGLALLGVLAAKLILPGTRR